VQSYDGSGQRAVFVRNPQYMYPGLPYIDRIEYRWGVDPSLQMLQLEHGDADLVGDGAPSTQVAAIEANPATAKYLRPFPSPGVRWISLYQNHPELKDVRVRQALNWAVDREAIGRVVKDAAPWGGPFPQDMAGMPASYQPYGNDVEKAKALMSEAGVSSLSLQFTFSEAPPYPQIAQILQQQYRAINVHLSLNQVSNSALYSLEQKQTPQMSGDSWYLVQPTPADIVNAVYISSGSSNYNKYSNPRVDELAKKAVTLFDVAERNAVYGQIEQLITDDAPGIFLMSLKWLVAVSPDVQNYQYRGETYSYYDRLWF
jgi:peptide/nickel transport system substrate-binding protein